MPRQSGFTLLELLFTMALLATAMSIALPAFSDAVDTYRTASAARYVAGRVNLARMDAVKRNTNVGLKFEAAGSDYTFAEYVDGNANGIRNLDIRIGVDRLLAEKAWLSNSFSGVRFGLM